MDYSNVATEYFEDGVLQVAIGQEWLNRQLRRDDLTMDQTRLTDEQMRRAREIVRAILLDIIDERISGIASAALEEVRR